MERSRNLSRALQVCVSGGRRRASVGGGGGGSGARCVEPSPATDGAARGGTGLASAAAAGAAPAMPSRAAFAVPPAMCRIMPGRGTTPWGWGCGPNPAGGPRGEWCILAGQAGHRRCRRARLERLCAAAWGGALEEVGGSTRCRAGRERDRRGEHGGQLRCRSRRRSLRGTVEYGRE